MTTDRKRVLGIVGSPRRGGNTDVLVEEVLVGASEAGALTEKVVLNKLDIHPCRACEACFKTGRCVQKDDMPALLEKMDQSDVWVLGTPVYWWGPSAQFKTFLDRWFGQGQVVGFKGRPVILTIPLGASDASFARHIVGMFEGSFAHLEMNLLATIVVPDVWEVGKVRERPDVLAVARRAGRDAVEK